MPERLQIATIDYQRHLLQDEEFSKPPSKLVPNLRHKTKCIIHYHKSTNSRRVLLFVQLPWLENYINFNTRQRTAAKNDFEKEFFKAMIKAVFGKYFCLYIYLFFAVLMYWFIH